MKNSFATEKHVAGAVTQLEAADTAISAKITTIEANPVLSAVGCDGLPLPAGAKIQVCGGDPATQGGTISLPPNSTLTPVLQGGKNIFYAYPNSVSVSSRAASTAQVTTSSTSVIEIAFLDPDEIPDPEGRGVFKICMTPDARYDCRLSTAFLATSAIVGGLAVDATVTLSGPGGFYASWVTPLYVTPTVSMADSTHLRWDSPVGTDITVPLLAGTYTCKTEVRSVSLGPTPYRFIMFPNFKFTECNAYAAQDLYPVQPPAR